MIKVKKIYEKKDDIKKSLRFYAITDRKTEDKEEFYKDVEIAINSGINMLQLREKNISENEFIEESKVIKKMCKEKGVKFIINDNYKIAKLIDADGVHIGQKDGDLSEIRKYLGENKIIGVTAKNPIQAKLAQEGRADYLGSGAIFGTSTKMDATKMTYEELDNICKSVEIPVVAIGGISHSNIKKLKGLGIAGVAISGGIFRQNNIKETCENILEELNKINL